MNGNYTDNSYSNSELVIGLVGAAGTETDKVINILRERLKAYKYEVELISISKDIITEFNGDTVYEGLDEYERIKKFMDSGNLARQKSGDYAILALGAAAKIYSKRRIVNEHQTEPLPRKAFIIKSLKHPEEVLRLRDIYPNGFNLIGIYSDWDQRFKYLTQDKFIKEDDAKILMKRDEDEDLGYGQKVTDTFHLSDFFVFLEENDSRLKNSIQRFLDIIFADPHKTPTIDEYAMFLAFSASLRSAGLSRQVGAVIANEDEIIAIGANDCPKFGGGLYWPLPDLRTGEIKDVERGRDWIRNEDSNKVEQNKIIEDILGQADKFNLDKGRLRDLLKNSRIHDLTEFGRSVHAEMEAIIYCARNNTSTKNATLYCTTFPCHNCAKHIVDAGIKRVVYIEPYQKSKAFDLHDDTIKLGFEQDGKHVVFEPFMGIGPRRFFDLFSLKHGSGFPIIRRDSEGKIIKWERKNSRLRLQMFPYSYLDSELRAASDFNKKKRGENGTKQ
jgi:deoxycytidylate deaminase